MTPEEQQQMNAAITFLEQRVVEANRAGAQMAMAGEALAVKLKAAEARIAELEKADAPKD